MGKNLLNPESHWRKESNPDLLVRGADTDPHQNFEDPQHWFWGLSGSGSLIRIKTWFLLFCDFSMTKLREKIIFLLVSWKQLTKREGSGSVIQCTDPRIKMSGIRNTGWPVVHHFLQSLVLELSEIINRDIYARRIHNNVRYTRVVGVYRRSRMRNVYRVRRFCPPCSTPAVSSTLPPATVAAGRPTGP